MSTRTDVSTVLTLRSDLALQIARHIRRSGQSQVSAAQRLAIPQPTLSQIMNGRVSQLSLELLIRIAVRAGLPVMLQTGIDPQEAGVFVSGGPMQQHAGSRSKLAEEARVALTQGTRALTPEQRLEAHAKHSELVTALHRAGQRPRGNR